MKAARVGEKYAIGIDIMHAVWVEIQHHGIIRASRAFWGNAPIG
jgi:hypothetical protein